MVCFAQSWSESILPATVLMQSVQRMTIKNQPECKAGNKERSSNSLASGKLFEIKQVQ